MPVGEGIPTVEYQGLIVVRAGVRPKPVTLFGSDKAALRRDLESQAHAFGHLPPSAHVAAIIRPEIHEEFVKCGGELDDLVREVAVGDSDELFTLGTEENGRAMCGRGIVPGHKDAEVIDGFASDKAVQRRLRCAPNRVVRMGGMLKRVNERGIVAIHETAKAQESRSDGFHLVRSKLRDRLEDEPPVGNPSVRGAK